MIALTKKVDADVSKSIRIYRLCMAGTVWKVSKCGVFSGLNTGKYGPEKTPYLDTFQVVRDNTKLARMPYFHCSTFEE